MQVDVVSPEAIVWSGEANFVVAKTVEGEIGVLPNHEPLMAAIATGAVEIQAGDGAHSGWCARRVPPGLRELGDAAHRPGAARRG